MLTFRDQNGEARLVGTLSTSGGATGDVLTQQADGTLAPETPSGGGAVSCGVTVDSDIDAHAASPAFFEWSLVVDNLIEGNELEGFPAGIGLDDAGIGTDTLTTTEAGTWAFTLVGLAIPTDATWIGQALIGNNVSGIVADYPAVTSSVRSYPHFFTQVVTLPSGTGFSVGIISTTPSTADPFTITAPALQVVRLG